jgi:DNA-binding IclR family transcriptional regulator
VGRNINPNRKQDILKTIAENNGQLRASNLARLLKLHAQEVSRVLTSLEDSPEKFLYEDDRGFLGIFKSR